jgi:UDP-N-acetylglucosamine--N-acetylmuramyl-(pentapeptide) pyrophosphoryl-undecaprenol N-acetylglucosamine transferase
VWLAADEATRWLPPRARNKVRVTGAPIVPPDESRRPGAMARFAADGQRPVVVVTGGSQGSLAINRAVAEALRAGRLADLQLIWATGKATHEEFADLHHPPAVTVLPFIDPMADAWAVADACIARSGMMTLAELAAWGIPAVLVPLPTSAADHQAHNARAAAASGSAVVLPQAELTPATLESSLRRVLAERQRMARAARDRARPTAAADIAARAVALVA